MLRFRARIHPFQPKIRSPIAPLVASDADFDNMWIPKPLSIWGRLALTAPHAPYAMIWVLSSGVDMESPFAQGSSATILLYQLVKRRYNEGDDEGGAG